MKSKPTIIAAWAESAAGPALSNRPIWYLTQDRNGELELHALQPSEQSKDMRLLYPISECCHRVLVGGVYNALYPPRKRKPENTDD